MTSTIVKPPRDEGKKDVQKLQRAIIDGLEDVKAQDIQVFDTEHITSLFERVIVASGTSNRQTKALAASVRDAVREAGFAKPRIEGEENGEWIIVDCGAAVAHIMQPTIRQYYNLEELWGEKPIKLKLGAPAPLPKAESKAEAKPAAKPRAGSKAKPAAKVAKVKKETQDEGELDAKKAARTDDGTYAGRVGKTHDWTAQRNAMEPAAEPQPKTIKARKSVKVAAPVEGKTAAPRAAAKKAAVKTPIVKIPATKKVAAKKAAVKTAAKTAVKSAVKKPAAKRPAAKKATPRSE